MTILFLTRLFYPHIGGVEKHVFEISKRLVKKGYRVVILTEQHDKKLRLSGQYKGIEVHRIPVGNFLEFKKFRIWQWLWQHRLLIKSADIVHCHDVAFWFFPFKFLYPRKPIFTTFHGYESFPVKKRAIFVRKVSEILSWGNICVGEFMKRWYLANPTFVSYGGVDIKEVKNQKSKVKINNKSAVFIGRLDEQTGILTYVEAVRKIREKYPKFKIVVYGEGKFKNKILPFVDYRGIIKNPQDEIKKYNFVFASRYLSIIEAMAAKRIVFAVYDNPLKEDYLRMSPFVKYITISGSSSELISKITFYLENSEEKKKLIKNACKLIGTYTWEKVTNVYMSLWSGYR